MQLRMKCAPVHILGLMLVLLMIMEATGAPVHPAALTRISRNYRKDNGDSLEDTTEITIVPDDTAARPTKYLYNNLFRILAYQNEKRRQEKLTELARLKDELVHEQMDREHEEEDFDESMHPLGKQAELNGWGGGYGKK